MVRGRRRILVGIGVVLLWSSSLALPALAAEFEAPPTFKAGEILPPELLQSEHHRVEEIVENDGYLNYYRIESDFGPFDALAARPRAITC